MIGAVMVWIVGIAVILGILRTVIGPIALFLTGGTIAFYGAWTLTHRGVRWLDRRLIEARRDDQTAWRPVIEFVLLVSWGIFLLVFTFMLGLTIAFGGPMVLIRLKDRFL